MSHSLLPADIKPNQALAVGLSVAVLGSTVSIISSLFSFVWQKIKARFIVTLEVNSRDPSYAWLYEWLNVQPYTTKTRRLTVETTYYQHGEGDNRPKILFIPALGSHLLTYKTRWVWMTRTQVESVTDPAAIGGVLENITLTTFGKDISFVKSIIYDAMTMALKKEKGKTTVFANGGGSWAKTAQKDIRPMVSVVLDEGIKSLLLDDICTFLKDQEWYKKTGIPYRRGYLLYGPPGTGKTSFISALAGELDLSICQVSLSNREIDNDELNKLLNNTPHSRCIILIEDVDCVHCEGKSKITLTGLLNTFDGVSSQEGRLVFMTTNHIEKLDAALIRPGRVDMKVHFGLASKYQAEQLFLNFFPGKIELAKEFATLIPNKQLSMAQLQGYLQLHRTDPHNLISELQKKKQPDDWKLEPGLPEIEGGSQVF